MDCRLKRMREFDVYKEKDSDLGCVLFSAFAVIRVSVLARSKCFIYNNNVTAFVAVWLSSFNS